jgi:hypothetical protein
MDHLPMDHLPMQPPPMPVMPVPNVDAYLGLPSDLHSGAEAEAHNAAADAASGIIGKRKNDMDDGTGTAFNTCADGASNCEEF